MSQEAANGDFRPGDPMLLVDEKSTEELTVTAIGLSKSSPSTH